MIEPNKLANCRAAFYQLTHGCVFYTIHNFSSPHPRLPSHPFSRRKQPPHWKQFGTIARKNSKNWLLDLIKYCSRDSHAWEHHCYQVPADTLAFLSRQPNDCFGQGQIATTIIK